MNLDSLRPARLMRAFLRVVVYLIAFAALPLGIGYLGLRSTLAAYLAPTPVQPLGRDLPPPPVLDPDKPTVAVVLGDTVTEVADMLGPYVAFKTAEAFNVITVAAQDRSLDVRGLYKIESPRLLEWVAHVDDLDPLIRALAAAHIESKPIFPGSRKRPDGEVLRWRALNLKDNRGGLLPFFIEWGADSAHPASDSPAGCELTSFAVIDPDPGSLRATFRTLQLEDVQVEAGPRPRLRAVVKGPKGTLEL